MRNHQLPLYDIIQINDKKYSLSKPYKIYQHTRLLKFKNKPIEKYLKISIEKELIINHIRINIDYNNLESFFYNHNGTIFNFDKTEVLYFEQKISKCRNCNHDKKYIIYELLFQYSESRNKYRYYKKVISLLEKIINIKICSHIIDILEYDLLLKLIARYIFLQISFNNIKLDVIEKYLNSISKFSTIHNYYYFTIKFYTYCFKNLNNKDIKNILDKQFSCFEKNLSNFIGNNSFSVIDNLSFMLAEAFENASNFEKAQFYYKQEIDKIINYYNAIENKDLSLSVWISKAINISVKYTQNGSYKLEELKKYSTDLGKQINMNMNYNHSTIQDTNIDKAFQEYYDTVKNNLIKSIHNDKEILIYIFLDFTHFSFIKSDIIKNIEKEQNHSLVRHLCSVVHVSHYGRISFDDNLDINDKEAWKQSQYSDHLRLFIEINNQILFNLDYETKWVLKTKDLLLNYIDDIYILDKEYKKQTKKSIYAFLEGDYMVFCHLALPIIEHILRNYLEKINGDSLSVKNVTTVQYKTLNELLTQIKQNKDNYIDKGILDYFIYILVEPNYLNLRNVILHGFMPENGFNKWNSMYIYTILLYLIIYFKNDELET